MAKLTVEVTQEDIDQAERFSTNNCMVARSLRRHGFPDAIVGVWVWSTAPNNPAIYPLPQYVGTKIISFTSGDYVSPFSFEIEIPD